MSDPGRPGGMQQRTRLSVSGIGALIALPVLVIVLNLAAWVTAVSRSGFWADDFLNVTHFSHTLGDLSDDHINQGKYVVNVFWWLGTEAFGSGSVVPFLLVDGLVFALGVFVWLRVGARTRWTAADAWWIGGLFVATEIWLPTALWSSNIVHSIGFLALGGGLWTHERCMRAVTQRGTLLWSLACGLMWTLAVISNLLYLGLLVLAVYCGMHQVLRVRSFGLPTRKAAATVSSWALALPLLYFAAVGYPGTTANSAYAHSGLHYLRANLHFYRANIAPSGVLLAAYILVFVIALAGGVVGARRRDWFALAVLSSAVATTLPALVQSQQRDIHYLAMPALLLFSAAASALRELLRDSPAMAAGRFRFVTLAGAIIVIFLLFRQGADVRSYFVQTPYGHDLAAFRTQVEKLTPSGSTICASMELQPAQQSLLTAELSGQDGFVVAPVDAAGAYLLAPGESCPAGATATRITIKLDARGQFVASG